MSAIKKRKVAKIQTSYVQERELADRTSVIKKKLLFRRLTVFFVFAAVLSFIMISTVIAQTSFLEEKQAEKEKLGQKLSDLKKKEEVLKEEIVKLNDDEYIAKLARRDYFLSQKSEIIFNLPKKDKEKSTKKASY